MFVPRSSLVGLVLCVGMTSCAQAAAPVREPALPAPGTEPPRAALALGVPQKPPPNTLPNTATAHESVEPSEARELEPNLGIEARYPFHTEVSGVLTPDSPAMKYANLAPASCRTLVERQKLPVKRDRRPTPGVATALRFTGPVDGVRFVTAGDRSPFGVMDCRLVMAFQAMTEVLLSHSVSEVHIGTIYRKSSKLASKVLSQHAHGLAADIIGFKVSDGPLLNIEQDFGGQLGEPVCGPESHVEPPSDAAIRLRNLVCDLARAGLFHYMLTPNYDTAHHDHLHVDIKRNAKRTVIR